MHMAWTGLSSGLANLKQAMAPFTPRAGGSAAPKDPSPCICRKTICALCHGGTHANHTNGSNAEPTRLMQVDIMVGYLKLRLLQISLEIFAPDHHSK